MGKSLRAKKFKGLSQIKELSHMSKRKFEKIIERMNNPFENCTYYDKCFIRYRFEKDMIGCVFVNCNFTSADLAYISITDCMFDNCNLSHCTFQSSNLINTVIKNCIITDTEFFEANFTNPSFKHNIGIAKHFNNVCPATGSYIAFKKCKLSGVWASLFCCNEKSCIIKLEIPHNADRSSATSDKCRASVAKVLDIQPLERSKQYNWFQKLFIKAVSIYDSSFEYKIGKTVHVSDFDFNVWDQCSTGIHHFMDRDLAADY